MIYNTVTTTISLLGIYGIVFWLYRDYRIDSFRQSMFSIRDELFDFAANGNIDFDHPAYTQLRELINGYIRFGHRVRILPLFLFYSSLDRDDQAWMSAHSFDIRWTESTNNLDVPTARSLYSIKDKANHKVSEQLILGSPLLVCTIVPAGVLIVALWLGVGLAGRLLDRMRESIEIAAPFTQPHLPSGSVITTWTGLRTAQDRS